MTHKLAGPQIHMPVLPYPIKPISINKIKKASYTKMPFTNGADDRARTDDNRYHKPGLYQLSYVRHQLCFGTFTYNYL